MWEGKKVRQLVVSHREKKTDFSLPEEPKPFLAFLPDHSPPTCCLPEGYQPHLFLPCCCLPAEMWVQLKIKRASVSVPLNCWLKNTAQRNGIFSLKGRDKVLKCQHDKSKINNSNKPCDAPKNVRLVPHAVQWSVLDDLGAGRGLYNFHSYNLLFWNDKLLWNVPLTSVKCLAIWCLQSWHRHCAQINIRLVFHLFLFSAAWGISHLLPAVLEGGTQSYGYAYQEANASPPSTHLGPFVLSSQDSGGRWDNWGHSDHYPCQNFPHPQGKSFGLNLHAH